MPQTEQPLYIAEEFRGGGRILPEGDWSMQMHQHPYHEIIIVLRGQMHVSDDKGVTYVANPGDVLLYPAHIPHQERSSLKDPVETIFLSFHGELEGSIQQKEDSNARVQFLASCLLEDLTTSLQVNQAKATHYLNLIAHELAAFDKSSPGHALITRARNYMRENMHRKILLQDIAAHCNLSQFHFARKYGEQANVSPMADLKLIRLNMAKSLIRSTELPLKYIADQTGFANEFHLSREFSRHFGKSTSAYRSRL